MNGNDYLPPRLLQLLGIALLIGSAVFWGWTGRESALLMGAAMSLILLGSYKGALDVLKNQRGDEERK